MILGPGPSASHGSLSKRQIPWPHSDLLESQNCWNRSPMSALPSPPCFSDACQYLRAVVMYHRPEHHLYLIHQLGRKNWDVTSVRAYDLKEDALFFFKKKVPHNTSNCLLIDKLRWNMNTVLENKCTPCPRSKDFISQTNHKGLLTNPRKPRKYMQEYSLREHS